MASVTFSRRNEFIPNPLTSQPIIDASDLFAQTINNEEEAVDVIKEWGRRVSRNLLPDQDFDEINVYGEFPAILRFQFNYFADDPEICGGPFVRINLFELHGCRWLPMQSRSFSTSKFYGYSDNKNRMSVFFLPSERWGAIFQQAESFWNPYIEAEYMLDWNLETENDALKFIREWISEVRFSFKQDGDSSKTPESFEIRIFGDFPPVLRHTIIKHRNKSAFFDLKRYISIRLFEEQNEKWLETLNVQLDNSIL